MDSGVLTNTLQLPTALAGLTLEKATLYTQLEGAIMNGVDVELYEWSSGTWVSHPDIVGSVPLDQPARFVSPTGLIQLRLDWQGSGMVGKGGACVNLDLGIEGVAQ
jgi:hypothetical protein